ncbi:type II secretion system protein [Herbaspirillum frisingense]|uniref:type II secretion system protein n=1 Tax=Herbaspirillum frisingense TaxID=92645 RepID=UPI001F378304|nr:type II secretion system protein [Herbaspirillum frisingense]UIN19843.1 type II secretion system GspH family protein [Herbaspirillum frisingense]
MNLLTLPSQPGAGHIHGKTNYAPLRRLRQCGFTLVELSVSMAIAAILAVASLEVMRQQLDQTQVASSSYFLKQTMVALQNFFATADGTTPINNSALANGAAVARQYVGGGAGDATVITNPWGGQLFVGSLIGGGNSNWVLQVSGLPMRLCSDIVQNLESSLNVADLRHALAGAATTGGEITTPALRSVSLDPGRALVTTQLNVHVLKNDPYAPLSPAALTSLCETNRPYFNLFLTGNNHAL